MIRPQFSLDLHDELVTDNFAGGGGASTGIELALGRNVDHAINHDRNALGMHRINHPQTVHHCEDVWAVDPPTLTEGRRVGYAHFSPDCTDFSKAKGGKPLRKKIRGLAWVMVKWARTVRPRVMSLENVEEFQTWGPLLPDGTRCPKRIGKTFRSFVRQLENIGYVVEWRELRACDYGAPTIRKRLFLIARCDGSPIVWPAATHADPKLKQPGLKPWRTIAECIDWSLRCPSIFLTKTQARAARCKRPLAKATLRRIATGMDRYVLKSDRPFLVSLTHQGGDRVEPVDQPAKTITGAHRGEKAIVVPALQKFHGNHKGRKDGDTRNHSVTDPLLSQDTSNRFGLSEATLAPIITEHANASTQRNFAADEPMRTQCGQVKGGHFALVSANLMVNTTGHSGAKADEPAPTIPTGGHHAVVTGTLVHTAHGDQDKKGKRRGRGAHDITESMPAVLGSPDCAVAAANLIKLRGDVATHSKPEAADEPLHVISAGGQHHGIAAAYLAQHNDGKNTNPGHPATEPISAISAKGCQQQVVAASAVAFYGNDKDGQGLHEPARTVTTKDRLGLVESQGVSVMTPEQIAGARRVAKFLRAHGVQFEGEFATVAGYVIIDIGMRMLTPRELFLAQGFPADYVIDRAWLIHPQTGALLEVRLTKEQQIRMCGNSVSPPVMAAIVRANVPELATWWRGETTRKPRPRRKAALVA